MHDKKLEWGGPHTSPEGLFCYTEEEHWGKIKFLQSENILTFSCALPLDCFFCFLCFFLLQKSVFIEKAMAPHSSTLAWKMPWIEEPGGLQSMGSGRVGHDWVTSLWLFTFMHWRRKWQPTPVFLPGEPLGRGSLVGCHPWDPTESDTTEAT